MLASEAKKITKDSIEEYSLGRQERIDKWLKECFKKIREASEIRRSYVQVDCPHEGQVKIIRELKSLGYIAQIIHTTRGTKINIDW